MILVNGDGVIEASNEASCQQTGYAAQALQQLPIYQLFPENPPASDVPFATYKLRQHDGTFVEVLVEVRPFAHKRHLLILHPPDEAVLARQKIAHLTDTIQTINDLALKLNALLIAENPVERIAHIIQEIPGVFGVSVSIYDSKTKELVIRQIAVPPAESGIIKRVNTIIGRSLLGMRIPVTAQMHQRLLHEQIATLGDLHEVTFGEVPKPISRIFHRTFHVDKMYGLSLIEGGELLGTIAIAMRRNAEPLTEEVRKMVGRICAMTLRRSRYEQELQGSEAKFRSYIEHAPLGIFVLGRNGRILETNPAGTQMLQYTLDELQTLTIADIADPTFLEQGLADFQTLLQIGQATGEYGLRTKDSNFLWAAIDAIKLTDERVIIFAQDITPRKQAEQSNQLKDELLHLTGDMGKIGAWQFDTETFEGTWTDEVARIHDVDPERETNTNFGLSFYKGEHRKKIEDAIQALMENGTPYDLELQMTSAKGLLKWVRTVAIPIWENGKVVRVRGIFQDISDSKNAEEALRQQIALQHQLSQVAATVPGMICAYKLTPDGHASMPYASAALDDIYGLPLQAVVHDAGAIFEIMHRDDREAVLASIRQSAETMQPWYAEYRINHPVKGERWIEGLSMPHQEEDGSILWHGFVQDITPRKKAEKEQAELEAQLRQVQKMDSIGRLAGGIAHDFNNLLTVIQMYADLMHVQMKEDDPLRPKLGQIMHAGARASELTSQLLAFSRKQILKLAVIDLNKQIVELQKMLKRLIGEDIAISVSLTPDLWAIQADPGQMEQVILNLVVNARDAMPTGGQIAIETQNVYLDESLLSSQIEMPTGPCVLLAISDTGFGMDEATRQRIFEPFFTTKEPGNGTGLGLATVHGIVRQSGGSIFVYSEINQGTTFKIYLPASEEAVATIQKPRFELVSQVGTETILVVEDEDSVRTPVCATLEATGYTILAAPDGPTAVSLLAAHNEPIDLLLTDVVMPHMSGRELAEKLQQTWPELKVLFMSGYMDDAVVRHGILTAQVAFLPKPFSSNTLIQKVREILDE